MNSPDRKVVYLQWFVIAVLVIGAGIGGYMLYQKAEEYKTTVDTQQGDVSSLREQLRQAKENKTPAPNESALPESSSNASAIPTPSASPKATATPSPTTKP